MTRREFIKGTAAFLLLCAAGWKSLPQLETALRPTAETAVGPLLVEGLELLPVAEGADVLKEGLLLFQVNSTGLQLLQLADGTSSLGQIIERVGASAFATDAAMFFVTLGEAGYLQNRVEVSICEYKA